MLFHFSHRSLKPEILDDFELQGNNLAENLKELEWVNRYLGGYSQLGQALQEVVETQSNQKHWHVADIGCGGGDTLRYLAKKTAAWPQKFRLTGVDANAHAIAYAKSLSEGLNIGYQKAMLSPELLKAMQADVVLFNLFLHHFKDEEIIEFLSTCQKQGVKVIITDLERSKLAYFLFNMLTRIIKFSHISRHDGLLSIQKSFTQKDWAYLFHKSNYSRYTVKWRWAFRWVCCLNH